MRRKPAHPRLAQGSALVFILIILMAGAAFLVSALKSNPQVERDKITADALAQAKEALIGYAATYRDKGNPNDVFGYLPLPDMGTSRATATEGSNAANFAGITKNLTVIGRLPWQALGLPASRDNRGECLWYAVSGSFQNTQKADVLNWDSLGHFDAYSSNGTAAGTASTTGNNFHQRPVAIIFSAGEILSGQDRQTSTTDTVTTCGGNYDVRNYLDAYNADANISNIVNYFTGTTNNSTGYAYNLTGASNGSLLDATALAAPKKIIFGSIETNLGKIVNDRILVITADEIFKRIKQRDDFKNDIDTLMNDLAAYLNGLPAASLPAASGSKGIGNVISGFQAANPALSTKKTNILNNWKENLLYAKLPSPTAITIDSVSTTPTLCTAVLIFGGERVAAQTRSTSVNKDDATMYLEGNNVTAFPGGTAYSGTSLYSTTAPSVDVMRCITGTPDAGPWPFEYPTQWNGVPPLNASEVAVGGTSDTTGTSGNNDVIIPGNLTSWINLGSGNDELLVSGDFTGGGSFGAGDDTVKIVGDVTSAIDLGSGDDYLDIGGDSGGYIDSGAGNDQVFIGGNATASISFGSGNDELHIEGNASGYIDMGSGSDKVRIDQNMSAYIDLGNDDDYLVIFGNTVGMQAGSGNDTVLIGGDAAGWLDLGPGNDYLEILGNSAGLDAGSENDIIKITGNATNTINLGSGNDYLRVGGTITWIDGGAGTDRIYLMAYNVTNCASLLTSRISANVEHVKVSDGMCRGSNFTFP